MNQINQLKHNSAHYFEGTCAVNFFNCLILILLSMELLDIKGEFRGKLF